MRRRLAAQFFGCLVVFTLEVRSEERYSAFDEFVSLFGDEARLGLIILQFLSQHDFAQFDSVQLIPPLLWNAVQSRLNFLHGILADLLLGSRQLFDRRGPQRCNLLTSLPRNLLLGQAYCRAGCQRHLPVEAFFNSRRGHFLVRVVNFVVDLTQLIESRLWPGRLGFYICPGLNACLAPLARQKV